MSHVNGYVDFARFVEQAAAAQVLAWRGMERVADLQLQAMASTVGDILDVAVKTATSLGAWVGPPARA